MEHKDRDLLSTQPSEKNQVIPLNRCVQQCQSVEVAALVRLFLSQLLVEVCVCIADCTTVFPLGGLE